MQTIEGIEPLFKTGIGIVIIGSCNSDGFGMIGNAIKTIHQENEASKLVFFACRQEESFASCASDQSPIYGGEMKLDISKCDLERLHEAYMKFCEKGKLEYQYIVNSIYDDVKINHESLDTSQHISRAPYCLRHPRLKQYSKAYIRPPIVRKGCRSSKRKPDG